MNETEYELIKKYQSENDINARNKVITMNMGYLHLLASRYHGIMYDDLIQEGVIELIKTIKNYDTHYDTSLISFSHNALSGAMNRYFLRNMDVVHKYTTKPLLKMVRNASKYYFDGSDDYKIMKELNVTKQELQRFQGIQHSSLEIDHDDFDFHIPGKDTDNPLTIILNEEYDANIVKIQNAIDNLDARCKDIIIGRWLNYDITHTLGYYAEKYGISGERVRQLEKNSIKRISSMVAI